MWASSFFSRASFLVCGFVCLSTAASLSIAEVRFQAVTVPFEHQYLGGWEHFVGGGVSSFDCDEDGFYELYVAGGTSPAVLLKNQTAGSGETIEFTLKEPSALSIKGVTGSYPIDINNDSILDLVILRVGPNRLMQGKGDCEFEPFAEGLEFVSGDHWTTAFSATWEPSAKLPTLAFGNYIDRKDPEGPFGKCASNFLYRSSGGDYSMLQELNPGYCSLSLLFSDWGRKGRADLRISNDRHYHINQGGEQLWTIAGVPRAYTEADGWVPYSIWGMGIASRDLNGDGRPEIFLTSMGDQKLHSLDPKSSQPTYRDAPYQRGISAHRPYTGDDGRPSTGWHAEFADLNNDGLDDLFIAKGNVEQMPGSAMLDPNNLLIQQLHGRFIEQGDRAGVASLHRGRGAVLNDLNQDGLLDLVVVNRRADLEIYQNVSTDTGRWLQISLNQTGVNRHAIGAWIEIEAQTTRWSRELTVGGGHASGSAAPEHFGLGTAKRVKVRVIWPDGEQSQWIELETNQRTTIVRRNDNRITSGQSLGDFKPARH